MLTWLSTTPFSTNVLLMILLPGILIKLRHNRKPETTVFNLDSKITYKIIFKVRPESASACFTSPESESSDPIETLSPIISQPGKPIHVKVHDSQQYQTTVEQV